MSRVGDHYQVACILQKNGKTHSSIVKTEFIWFHVEVSNEINLIRMEHIPHLHRNRPFAYGESCTCTKTIQ